jgi:hypothetical protein
LTSSGGYFWTIGHCDDARRARAIIKTTSTGNNLWHALHCAISCLVLTIFTIAALRRDADNSDQQPIMHRASVDHPLIAG